MNAPIFASPKSTKVSALHTFSGPPATPKTDKTLCFSTGKRRFLMYSDRLGVIHQTEVDRMHTDFDVLGVLGEGQCAVVYKCRDKRDGSLSAVKRFKKRQKGVSDRHANLTEVQRLAEISMGETGLEEFVVGFVDCWEQRNRLHVQTELCARSLEQELQESGILSEALVWKVLSDVCKALKLIHSHNLIHMDVKPANIMYGATCFKLCDLGLCAEEGQIAEEGDRTYLAPEVLQGRATFSSDIFSLGLVLLRCRRVIGLPSSGDDWQRLRTGRWLAGVEMSERLQSVVRSMLAPEEWRRPDVDTLIAAALPQTSIEGRLSVTISHRSLRPPSVIELHSDVVPVDHSINLSEVFKHM